MKRVHYLLIALLFSTLSFSQITNRVFVIGNSVTDGINYAGFKAIAESRSNTHVFARHMIPGSPLFLLWNASEARNGGFVESPYSYPHDAWVNYNWDCISLQPFDRHLVDGDPVTGEGDSSICAKYAKLAKTHNPNTQFYIYQRYPRTPNDKLPTDNTLTADTWNTTWNLPFSNGWDYAAGERRVFFERLTLAMRKSNIMSKPFLMIPAGEVMYQLNLKMAAGQVPGYSKIWQVYADGIHVNGVGSYILALTFYATMYKDDPRGMSVPGAYGSIPSNVASVIQQTVWEVVTTYKDPSGNNWSGVNANINYPVTGVILNYATAQLNTGQTLNLDETILPSNATNKAVTWSSSNSSVATVSNTGLVTAVADGSATITVTTTDGNKKADCVLTVVSTGVAVTAVSIDPSTLNIGKSATAALTAVVAPDNASNKNVTWSSSDPAIASVNASGLVTAVAKGSAVVTVTTENGGKKATCAVIVTVPNNPPVAVINSDVSTGAAPLVVKFDGSASSDPDADDFVLGYDWDFADGSNMESSVNPTHTFQKPGTYIVKMRAMDSNNLRGDWVSKTITVNENPNMLYIQKIPIANAQSLVLSKNVANISDPQTSAPASSDLSASVKSSWDNNNLYVSFDVTDNTLVTGWDDVEVFIDAKNEKAACNLSTWDRDYDVNDVQFVFKYGHTTPVAYPDGRSIEGVQYTSQSKNGGYTVDISIPFSAIGVSPVNAYSLGIDFCVDDYDTQTANPSREHKIAWFTTDNNIWKCPALMGNAQLLAPQGNLEIQEVQSLLVIQVSPNNYNAILKGLKDNKIAQIQLSDISGKLLYKSSSSSYDGMVIFSFPINESGYYIISVNSGEQLFTYKLLQY